MMGKCNAFNLIAASLSHLSMQNMSCLSNLFNKFIMIIEFKVYHQNYKYAKIALVVSEKRFFF